MSDIKLLHTISTLISLTSTGSTSSNTLKKIERVLMRPNNDGLGTLARNRGNDTGLLVRMLESRHVHARSSASKNNGLDLVQQPLCRLLSIDCVIVTIVESREFRQGLLDSVLAQLGQETSYSLGLRHIDWEIDSSAWSHRWGLVEVSDVDEVLVLL